MDQSHELALLRKENGRLRSVIKGLLMLFRVLHFLHSRNPHHHVQSNSMKFGGNPIELYRRNQSNA